MLPLTEPLLEGVAMRRVPTHCLGEHPVESKPKLRSKHPHPCPPSPSSSSVLRLREVCSSVHQHQEQSCKHRGSMQPPPDPAPSSPLGLKQYSSISAAYHLSLSLNQSGTVALIPVRASDSTTETPFYKIMLYYRTPFYCSGWKLCSIMLTILSRKSL